MTLLPNKPQKFWIKQNEKMRLPRKGQKSSYHPLRTSGKKFRHPPLKLCLHILAFHGQKLTVASAFAKLTPTSSDVEVIFDGHSVMFSENWAIFLVKMRQRFSHFDLPCLYCKIRIYSSWHHAQYDGVWLILVDLAVKV